MWWGYGVLCSKGRIYVTGFMPFVVGASNDRGVDIGVIHVGGSSTMRARGRPI